MKNKYRYSKTTLDNGMDVIVEPRPNEDVVAAQLNFSIGSRWEEKEQTGIIHLIEHAMGTSTENYPKYFQPIFRVTEKGGMMNLGTGPEKLKIVGEVTKEDTDTLLESMIDSAFRSNFKWLEKEKETVINEFKSKISSKKNRNHSRVIRGLYSNYYSLYILGNEGDPEDSIKRIRNWNKEKVKEIYKELFNPVNSSISIVGPVEPEKSIEKIKKLTSDLNKGIKKENKKPKVRKPPETIITERESNVNYLNMLTSISEYNTKNRLPMLLLDLLTAGSSKGKLADKMRKERGLYHISSRLKYTGRKGLFEIKLQTDKDVENIFEDCKEFLNNFESYISKEELEKFKEIRIKRKIRYRNCPTNEVSSLNHYHQKRNLEELKKFKEIINSITIDEVVETAENELKPEDFAVSILRQK